MHSLSDAVTGEKCTIWDHEFVWTDEHPKEDEITHYLYSYDELAHAVVERLEQLSPPTSKADEGCPHGPGAKRDIYALVKDHADSDETIGRLWKEAITVPAWVDWDQIERGQRVVFTYKGQILLGLLYKSLLGGMGAYRVVETLSRTGGFGINVTRRRLLETFQHFMEVIDSLASIQPHGKGFASSVRVRLLHATVRRRLLQLEHQRPGYFDVAAWGVPINHLHSIGTLSVYSSALIWMALPRQGVYLTEGQIADFLALWRYVGYLLGAPISWMDTPARAKAMMESIMVFEVQPSANSRIIASNILSAETNVPPLYAKREYLAAQAYRHNGDDLAGALGIEKPGVWYRFLVWYHCQYLRLFSWVYTCLPVDSQRRRDEFFRRIANDMITSQKMGGLGTASVFDFQYAPSLGKMTELGARNTNTRDAVVGRARSGGGGGGRGGVLVAVGKLVLASVVIVSAVRFWGAVQSVMLDV